jgi:hypothetical protein
MVGIGGDGWRDKLLTLSMPYCKSSTALLHRLGLKPKANS